MEVTSATNSNATANAYAALDSSEFVQILIEELQNQDPLSPNDSSAILEQLSSLRNIESQTLLGEQLEELVRQNQVSAAGNMIGKMVEGIDTSNSNTTGLVTSVRVTDDGVFLELDNGRTMDIDQITKVYEDTSGQADTPTDTPAGAPAESTTPPADATPATPDPITTASQNLVDAIDTLISGGNQTPTASRELVSAAAQFAAENTTAPPTVTAR